MLTLQKAFVCLFPNIFWWKNSRIHVMFIHVWKFFWRTFEYSASSAKRYVFCFLCVRRKQYGNRTEISRVFCYKTEMHKDDQGSHLLLADLFWKLFFVLFCLTADSIQCLFACAKILRADAYDFFTFLYFAAIHLCISVSCELSWLKSHFYNVILEIATANLWVPTFMIT